MKIVLLLAGLYNSGADLKSILPPNWDIQSQGMFFSREPVAPFFGDWPNFIPTTNTRQPFFMEDSPREDGIYTLEQAIPILQQMPADLTFNQMTSDERQALEAVHKHHVTPELVKNHSSWYEINMRRNVRERSGTAFIVMHRALLRQIENLVGPTFKMPRLTPGEVIPNESTDETFGILERKISAIPKYLSEDGENIGGTLVSLNTIDTLEKLGQLLIRLDREWHMSLGGDMREVDKSIRNRLFWPLHAAIDSIVDQWFEKEKGSSWSKKNQGHPIFSPVEDPMSYSNIRFAGEVSQCRLSPDGLCAWLAQSDLMEAAGIDMTIGSHTNSWLLPRSSFSPMFGQRQRPNFRAVGR